MTNRIAHELKLQPPIPTLENPYVQVDWIWQRFVARYKNASTIESRLNGLGAYKQFLADSGHDERLKSDPRFYLSVHWDHYAIYNAEKYWRNRKKLSLTTIRGYIGTLKQVINFAAAENLTPVRIFVCPEFPEETSHATRTAYTDEELSEIRRIISEATKTATRIANGYKRTGVGENPCVDHKGSISRFVNSKWKSWENIVWYFENILDCKPHLHRETGKAKTLGIRKFYRAAREYHGGVENVWKKLGVSPIIGKDYVAPLAMKLAMETGLNAEAVLNLKRDCYREKHPLTDLPYIRYYKERSTGEKDLHTAFFDQPDQADFHLRVRQDKVIRRTINLILKLTGTLVKDAREEDKDYLFLFQGASFSKRSLVGKNCVMRIRKGIMQDWSRLTRGQIEKRVGHKDFKYLNLSRFRPTKITQMVCDGHDFFSVQAIAGHASIQTTYKYVASHRLEPKAQREINAVLSRIHHNSKEFSLNPLPYATAESQNQPGFIYKGVLSDCKNVYDPPKAVRSLPNYQVGQSCTYWNMCFLCPNIIITKKHLPLIMSFARDIRLSFSSGNLMNVPNTILYQKILSVVEGVFDEFPEEDLQWAASVAECEDFYSDGVVYKGIENER